ncbi:MAG: hypothetical protein HY749_00235 [Gammaproteobacteria bacterium]|nr:hypothetical protein [Gammaproteobacteria bacterium]
MPLVTRIVRSKLTMPPLLPRRVLRTGLLEAFFAEPALRVVLVQAPAGFGKTTLLQQCAVHAATAGYATGWLTLDEADDDPTRVLAHLQAVIDLALDPQATPTAPPALAAPFGFVEDLINRIAASRRPLAIFVDDLHVLESPTILALLRRFVTLLPPRTLLFLASRSVPALGLSRMLVRGEARIVRSDELGFDREQTAQFLAAPDGERPEEAIVEELYLRTEGWPAVLELARLALANRHGRRAIDDIWFTGATNLEEYLADNVLAAQPAERQEFLLRTSILRVVTPPLADLLCEREDGEAHLAELERAGLFIHAVDREHVLYRYHSLFGAYLARQLERRHPRLVAELHARAMRWHTERGDPEEAMYHAVKAGRYVEAADLFERWSGQLVIETRLATVERWLDVLPLASVLARPRLLMTVLWALYFLRRFDKARPLMTALAAWAAEPGTSAADGRAVALLAAAERVNADDLPAVADVVMDFDFDLDTNEVFTAFEMAAAANMQGFYLSAAGRYAEALERAEIGKRMSRRAGSSFSGAYACSIAAAAEFAQGRVARALAQYAEGHELARRHRGSYALAIVAAGYAEVLYYTDALADAKSLLDDALPLIRQTCVADSLAIAHVTYAKLLAQAGDADGASQALAEARTIAGAAGLARTVAAVGWEQVREQLAAGEAEAARALAATLGAGEAPGAALVGNAELLEGRAFGEIRLLITAGDTRAALARCTAGEHAALACGRELRALKFRLLQARATFAAGPVSAAAQEFSDVIARAAQLGCLRLVAEEPEIAALVAATPATGATTAALARLRTMLPALPAARTAAVETGTDVEPLSEREREIVRMLARGLSNKDIGAALFISENTVKFHLKNLYGKLGVKNRTQAAEAARRLPGEG